MKVINFLIDSLLIDGFLLLVTLMIDLILGVIALRKNERLEKEKIWEIQKKLTSWVDMGMVISIIIIVILLFLALIDWLAMRWF